ncbi:hypothetical protein PF011_g17759 [Phytophthora fragariae]|uniref:Uncharacterized protein n=1 Tax=Phytophthora fragariae TaxID=53985 RepID=A0A6A3J9G2_9STRA|nr:hypothetical protein PF011_g17759 [Phytophthora fragariae]
MVLKTLKELEGKKGLIGHLKGLPGVRNMVNRLRSRSGQLTSTDAKELGTIAIKSSSKWKYVLHHVVVPFGIGVGIGYAIDFTIMAIDAATAK